MRCGQPERCIAAAGAVVAEGLRKDILAVVVADERRRQAWQLGRAAAGYALVDVEGFEVSADSVT